MHLACTWFSKFLSAKNAKWNTQPNVTNLQYTEPRFKCSPNTIYWLLCMKLTHSVVVFRWFPSDFHLTVKWLRTMQRFWPLLSIQNDMRVQQSGCLRAKFPYTSNTKFGKRSRAQTRWIRLAWYHNHFRLHWIPFRAMGLLTFVGRNDEHL